VRTFHPENAFTKQNEQENRVYYESRCIEGNYACRSCCAEPAQQSLPLRGDEVPIRQRETTMDRGEPRPSLSRVHLCLSGVSTSGVVEYGPAARALAKPRPHGVWGVGGGTCSLGKSDPTIRLVKGAYTENVLIDTGRLDWGAGPEWGCVLHNRHIVDFLQRVPQLLQRWEVQSV
jgi:hypothetical protein